MIATTLVLNDRVPVFSVDGAGVAYGRVLRPSVYTAGNPAHPYECLVDTNGYVRMVFNVLGAQDATKSIVIGWSYLANDQGATKALVDAQAARIGAGADGTDALQVVTINAAFTSEFVLSSDRANTAKTVYVALSGAVSGLCVGVLFTKLS